MGKYRCIEYRRIQDITPSQGRIKILYPHKDYCLLLKVCIRSLRYGKVQVYRIQEDPGYHSLTREDQNSISPTKTTVVGICQEFKTWQSTGV